MRKVMSVLVAMSFAALLVLVSGPALAQTSKGPSKAKEYGDKVHDQATRGAANVITGWMEVPKKIVEESKEGDTNPAWPLTGAAKGVAAGAVRTGVGAFEAVTSPVPQKGPIMDPETVDPEDKVTTIEIIEEK